jgi:large subunit ribosomal protein L27
MGRDHTIHATQPGFVKYYADPARHPKRRYIGVVFERNQTLPTPPNAARRRRLGLVAVRRTDLVEEGEVDWEDGNTMSGPIFPLSKTRRGRVEGLGRNTMTRGKLREGRGQGGGKLKMSSNYQFREPNWSIGRIPEREGISQKVREYDRGDRFLAWRKREARKARNVERKTLGASKGGKKKGTGKK